MKVQWIFLSLFLLVANATAQRQFDISKANQLKQGSNAAAILAMKTGPMAKIGIDLAELFASHKEFQRSRTRVAGKNVPAGEENTSTFEAANPLLRIVGGNKVVVDAVAQGDAADLLAEMEALGLENGETHGRYVSGLLPIGALETLAGSVNLAFALPSAYKTNSGSVTSRGDVTLVADQVRSMYGLDGSGVSIGTLSDSYDCLGGAAADVASGDLPLGVTVLDDSSCPGTDEGRGMMQLIHDVAPGSNQLFHTANNGIASFANGIIDLAVAGSDVIVDDIIYYAEPMYQDGIIGQAADIVSSFGIGYYSAAGNQGRAAYSSPFRSSGVPGVFGGDRHDFDPGPGVDDLQTVTLGSGLSIFVFQWANPGFSTSGAPGASSDLDMILYLTNGAFIGLGGFSVNTGGDPLEIFAVVNNGPPAQIQFGLELFSGPAPVDMKYVSFNSIAFDEWDTQSGTIYGHAGAAGAMAIGAVAWFNHPAYNPFVGTPFLNSSSSAGLVPIYFDPAGNPINDVRNKPNVVGPDGTNTTFFGFDLFFQVPGTNEPDGFPNFFGTSAAAPHVAAVAALIRQTDSSLNADQVYGILQSTAQDMNDPYIVGPDIGFDSGTGFGYVDAKAAVEAAAFDGNNKVKVCHYPGGNPAKAKTLSVGLPALNAHLAHGDKFGPCDQ